ncbi:21740_t:CDS:2 [Gigaspora margarita]|uniref:21740_t:CDS:1 n=1 Tax=Gigaspora margarita TaxID=4874 RepID=A0ABN7UCH8_GIGMA|nr:21740_t:CDS:2 [Gigaspora margarita]
MAKTLEMVLEDAQNIVILGTNSDILKNSLNIVEKLADTIQPFVPLISTIFVVVSEVIKIYENAKHNKKIEHHYWLDMNDLYFTITISNEEQRKLDQENLNADFEEMKQFLKTIAGGVMDNNSQINTIINKLQIINEKVELDDLLYREIKLCAGKSIVKKLYRGNNVVCKPTNIVDDGTSINQRIQVQLVILGKLKEYLNILKFYGLSNLDDNQVMVFEWANKGNLQELYLNQDIDLVKKVHIALDICRKNSTAKYWKAHYLIGGVFVNKDIIQAASLFKEAAKDNNTDACFHYALMITDKSSGVKYNCEKFIEYLIKAANTGNAMAQYNLGDMHLKENLPFLSNSDLGIKYLKLVALNSHSKAVEIPKQKEININE